MLVARDVKGIDMLYDKYGSFLFGLVYKIVKSEDVAEIVLQDTFLKVWDRIGSYSRDKGRFLTWMMNVARNTAIDMKRSKNYNQTLKLIGLESVPISVTYAAPGLHVDTIDVRDIVSTLDTKYKEIIELVYFEGYTHVEASDKLGIPLGTVKSRIRKAFRDLRSLLSN